jgi:hypothetical protein
MDVDNLSEKDPIELPFYWADLLAFVEFEVENKDLTNCLSPSASFIPSATSSKATNPLSSHIEEPGLVSNERTFQ